MNLPSVSARSLHCRALRLHDREIEAASVFPLFDRAGRVRWLMVVRPDEPDIALLKWRRGLVRVPLRGPVTLNESSASLQQTENETLADVAALWHFDPWWLLAQPRFVDNPATATLKATNSPNHFIKQVEMLYFRRDLSKANFARMRVRKQVQFCFWTRSLLPQTHPVVKAPQGTRRAKPTWALSPIWRHWTAPSMHRSWRPYCATGRRP